MERIPTNNKQKQQTEQPPWFEMGMEEAEPGGIPESGLCENSEFVNPEMRETLSYPFQKAR